jgi:hypothetical protein
MVRGSQEGMCNDYMVRHRRIRAVGMYQVPGMPYDIVERAVNTQFGDCAGRNNRSNIPPTAQIHSVSDGTK